MQAGNEEMKASHEEVTSINEELQSTNEELETSKEELQSLNEELTTVNAQLQAKMGELEATSNDLSSLLSSTDIAVLFLDHRFRIRRYTPAVKDLIDLIPSDIGRPLVDLRRKFIDPELQTDAQAVLDRLVPVEREVASDSGRDYLRRILPYRTADNRIDGVVVTFVDVTERKRSDTALRASEERTRLALDAAGMGSFVWYPGEDRGESDARTLALFGLAPDGPLTLDAAVRKLVHPDDRDRYAAAVARALDPDGSGELREEVRVVRPDGAAHWLAVTAQTEFAGRPRRPDRVVGVATDITARRAAEATLRANADRQSFLVRLGDAVRPLTDAADIQYQAARTLGEQLGASRVGYAEDSGDGETGSVTRQYTTGVPEIAGGHRYADFGGPFLASLLAGRPVVQPAATADPKLTAAEKAAHAVIQLAAFVYVPLVKDGRLLAVLFVHQSTPRDWAAEEVALIEETAERTWAALGRAKAAAGLRQDRDELEQRVRDRTAELITAQEARRELLGRLVTAQEEERRRIARELHDSLGQYLTAIGLGLKTLQNDLAAGRPARDELIRLADLTTETGRNVHRLALELRPTALDDLGLQATLQQYVEAWSARTGIVAEFSGRGLVGERFPWQVSTAVYRVAQESLTNVLRHARATRVSVLLDRLPDQLLAVIEDNGVGFDSAGVLGPPRADGGLGLLGMRERIALVAGTLHTESTPGAGTTVFVRIPLPLPGATDG
ncbi:MAG TPA: PAS domain-containing protein [Urbifossiella sp.]|nr:PAS domain-containing protein [Urbifossiella sp.]